MKRYIREFQKSNTVYVNEFGQFTYKNDFINHKNTHLCKILSESLQVSTAEDKIIDLPTDPIDQLQPNPVKEKKVEKIKISSFFDLNWEVNKSVE